ncbi:Glutamine amidotransferase class-I [Pseudomonas sp. NFACC23-1]|uniref:CTP synthase C-terminal region-related (seleno)protein n=1 Tax=unclassified Pseudomonas TaxID=196821 RepID=UPI00087EEAA3|nr:MULTISPECIES: CTP synthase [unclassified Pseudomonas]SDB60992.1 Glutamine amidotransferase class-I [Pseudomonas sp. NFACC17-2]SEJ86687.1 Glutamine amidotransferase class-I [Pseudomonas sp. NFACC23-1]SFW91754.1 Glutamine amidotransferase class-I [Pseudomonas sp. NFACC16-2]
MEKQRPLHIALIGDHDPQITAHRAIPIALELITRQTGQDIHFQWLATDSIADNRVLNDFNGVWCVPGSPYRSEDGAVQAIRFAREQRRPFLGTCGGFQHAVLEYARNVMGWADAAHGETDPEAERALLTPLSCALIETIDSLQLDADSLIAKAYGRQMVFEGYHCRFGVNPNFEEDLLNQRLHPVARDSAGGLRAVELQDHPFFVATLFQPERAALEGRVPPLVSAFVEACARTTP